MKIRFVAYVITGSAIAVTLALGAQKLMKQSASPLLVSVDIARKTKLKLAQVSDCSTKDEPDSLCTSMKLPPGKEVLILQQTPCRGTTGQAREFDDEIESQTGTLLSKWDCPQPPKNEMALLVDEPPKSLKWEDLIPIKDNSKIQEMDRLVRASDIFKAYHVTVTTTDQAWPSLSVVHQLPFVTKSGPVYFLKYEAADIKVPGYANYGISGALLILKGGSIQALDAPSDASKSCIQGNLLPKALRLNERTYVRMNYCQCSTDACGHSDFEIAP